MPLPMVPGEVQVILPALVTCAALVATAAAVLSITVQWAELVAAVTTAVNVAFSANSTPRAQFNICDPTAPLTMHPEELVAHVTPPPPGSASVSVPFFAVPGPRLVTT